MTVDNDDNALEFLLKLAETQGVACSTVSDGHVLLFKTSYLKALCEKHAEQEMLSIFIQRPDFKKTGN